MTLIQHSEQRASVAQWLSSATCTSATRIRVRVRPVIMITVFCFTVVSGPQLKYVIFRTDPTLYFNFLAIWSNISHALCFMQFCNVVHSTEARIRTSARGRLVLGSFYLINSYLLYNSVIFISFSTFSSSSSSFMN